MTSRPPDYRIAAMKKREYTAGKVQGNLGSAWINDDGRISLVFNPFVVVPVGEEYVISLFPYNVEQFEDIPF